MYILSNNIEQIKAQLEPSEYRDIDFDSIEVFGEKELKGDFKQFTNKLTFAKAKYPRGSYFLSATGMLRSPSLVIGQMRYSENYNGSIVCESEGMIYDNDINSFAKAYVL